MKKENLILEEKKWQKCQRNASLIYNPSSAAPGFYCKKCLLFAWRSFNT